MSCKKRAGNPLAWMLGITAACQPQPAAIIPANGPHIGPHPPDTPATHETDSPPVTRMPTTSPQARTPARPLYFASNRPNAAGGGFDIYMYDNTDHTVRALDVINTSANELQPQISPDGTTLAYCTDESGNFDIRLYSLSSRRIQMLARVNTPARDQSPSFSNDSQIVTFTSIQNQKPVLRWFDRRRQELYEAQVMNAVNIGVVDHTWSSDQNWVCFAGQVEGEQYDLLAYDMQGGTLHRLPFANTSANELSPALSTDGRSVLFTSDRQGQLDIYWLNLNTGIVSPLAHINTAAAEFEPRFSAETDQTVLFQSNRTGQPRIYRYHLDSRILDTLPLLSVPDSADVLGLP